MNSGAFIIIVIILFTFLGGALGWIINEVYDSYNYQREYNGLWLKGYNETQVDEITYEKDSGGDWVCVNIRDMSYKEALETCSHEVGHEIFAEFCEDNITKCFDVVNEIDTTTG